MRRDSGQAETEQRPLKRAEYDLLVDSGAFEDERVELLEGMLIARSPQGPRHAEVLTRLAEELFAALRGRATVRVQSPFAASSVSEPEPDLAVYSRGNYAKAHPERALLVVEVAETSLKNDREIKARIYAAAEVQEYWLVDLDAAQIEVRADSDGRSFRTLHIVGRGEVITPAAFPDVSVSIAGLFRDL